MSKILIEKETVELALEALEAKGDAWIVLERKAKAAIKAVLSAHEALMSQSDGAQSEPDLWAGATIDERWYITRQPKQEPVAWRWRMSLVQDRYWQYSEQPHPNALSKEPLYTTPPYKEDL